jgi:hypothetical protein
MVRGQFGRYPRFEWLETIEDARIARRAFAQLKKAKGSRTRAGWIRWSAVEKELA